MNETPSENNPPALHVDAAAARAALQEIDRISDRLRKSIAHGPASIMLILWGGIWATGYACTQFAPQVSGNAWLALDVGGILASIAIGTRSKTPVTGGGDARFAFFWLALFLYAGLWLWLLKPSTGNQIGAYWATVPMFAYVVGGLWLSRFFVYLGLTVTVLTVVGLLLFAPYFNLWMALVGGGSLISAGLYIRFNWR